MKILVIGSGGREHALCHTFWRQGHEVYCYPGNPGIWKIATPITEMSEEDAVRKYGIDLTVVGPEAPLAAGIQDRFSALNLPLFGPSQAAARLESSKAFAKEFMAKHHIPTAGFQVCKSSHEARQAALSFFSSGNGAVIKPSGLTGGKGVVCCTTIEEAENAIRQIAVDYVYGTAGEELVVEELLSGPEVSFQVMSDGHRMVPLIAAADHKRLCEGDAGPNTGGMGAYAPLPFLSASMQQQIEEMVVAPTLKGLQSEGILYQGILYFGLMLTEDGPKVLEFNCRFGDPESEAILPLLETDLAEAMLAAIRGNLDSSMIQWKKESSCCVVLAQKGYPHSYPKNTPMSEIAEEENLYVFHAGTALDPQGEIVASGGRVLCITGLGATLEDAQRKVYGALERTSCPWAHFRSDIGRSAVAAALS